MGRLTKEFTSCEYCEDVECTGYKNSCMHRKVYEKLRHYEDLEEQGRLIELPCKVGDTIYDITTFINKYDHPEILEMNVEWIAITEDKDGRLCFNISNFEYHQEEFGRIVFLTKEEAEAKLKELKEGVE